LVGLTSLRTRNPRMLPKLNRRRAMFVLTKIDEILAWEKQKEAERLGRYLCEVRAGWYWQVENLKSFDEFLERRFPESRRSREGTGRTSIVQPGCTRPGRRRRSRSRGRLKTS
jgi:hypothetical protein